ncbi:uncharacterized protein DEA37_0007115 [Paragonimus westermani]|uniref:Reverse transcriptase RNase H-like domain-containing protein n=1 Tax=Paragonimus westermani TaxID=34504 RepID=A0A5J4N9M5_9TREM|nr:uncharacterized protein DEA37_0007115 [Paragonimus westermani]
MAVEPQSTPISLGNRARIRHWDSPQWDRGIQRSSGTHQRPRVTGVPGDRRSVRPPCGRQPQRGRQRKCTKQINGKQFVVRTNHQALRWLKEFWEPGGKVARWQEELQASDFEWQYRPERQHTNADALSRRPARSHVDCPSCHEPHVPAVTLKVP